MCKYLGVVFSNKGTWKCHRNHHNTSMPISFSSASILCDDEEMQMTRRRHSDDRRFGRYSEEIQMVRRCSNINRYYYKLCTACNLGTKPKTLYTCITKTVNFQKLDIIFSTKNRDIYVSFPILTAETLKNIHRIISHLSRTILHEFASKF